MQAQAEFSVPIQLIEATLNSELVVELTSGSATHLPALHLVGELVRHTQDAEQIQEIVRGCLPLNYDGNTISEIPRMVADSIKNGFASKRKSKSRSPAADALALIDRAHLELFHTDQQIAYVAMTSQSAGNLAYPLRSRQMAGWLRLRFFDSTRSLLSKESLANFIGLLEARALFHSPEVKIFLRVGYSEEKIYFDLGQSDGSCVTIDSSGWEVIQQPPIRFYRPDGFAAQVTPAKGGDLRSFQRLLGLDEDNWIRLLAFILVCFMPWGPYLLLLVGGDHGSGKSKLSELTRKIIDPNALPKLRLPKDEHSLAIQAHENFVLVFDNTSSVRWDMSDALSALATGSGFSTRKFYEDDQSRTFKNCRPIIMNGIGDFVRRHDLLDRSDPLKLRRLDDSSRRTEREIDAEFEVILPGLLGAIFDVVSVALSRWRTVEPPRSIRMADAAQWLRAAEPATGLPEGAFLKALEGGIDEVLIDATVNNPLVVALFRFLDNHGQPARSFEGSVAYIHDCLMGFDHLARQLPKTPAHLSNELRRLRDGMARIGLMIEFQQRTNRAQPVRIWVEANDATPDERKRPEF